LVVAGKQNSLGSAGLAQPLRIHCTLPMYGEYVYLKS
jgi:hypothetical protein